MSDDKSSELTETMITIFLAIPFYVTLSSVRLTLHPYFLMHVSVNNRVFSLTGRENILYNAGVKEVTSC